jgi:hypothetical protein
MLSFSRQLLCSRGNKWEGMQGRVSSLRKSRFIRELQCQSPKSGVPIIGRITFSKVGAYFGLQSTTSLELLTLTNSCII